MWRKNSCCCRKDPGPALGSAPGLQCGGVVSLVSWMHLFKRPPPHTHSSGVSAAQLLRSNPLSRLCSHRPEGAIGVVPLCGSLSFFLFKFYN